MGIFISIFDKMRWGKYCSVVTAHDGILISSGADSLMYEIKIKDVYEDFSKDKEMFDFSNYSAKSKYYDDSNRLVVGKIKDETGGVAIEEFVGLKPKMYFSLVDNSSEHKKAKGVNVVEKMLLKNSS